MKNFIFFRKIIREGSEEFAFYNSVKNDLYDVKIFGDKILIPIIEHDKVDFFFSLENFQFDLFNFIDKVKINFC